MAKTPKTPDTETPEVDQAAQVQAMNELALRMFEGQSDHVPMIERVRRIKANLTDKGYGDFLSDIVLPHPDYKRYL